MWHSVFVCLVVPWAIRCEHDDWQEPELLRTRGPFYGEWLSCGMGSAVEDLAAVGDIDALYHNRKHSKGVLASMVKADKNGDELHNVIGKVASKHIGFAMCQ